MQLSERFGIGHLSRRTAWVGASKTLAFSSVIISSIYLARTLSISEFGRYRQGWLLIRTFIPILLLGIPQAINYFLPRAQKDRKGSYLSAFFFLLLSTGIVAFATSLLAPGLLAGLVGNPRLTGLIPLLGVYLLVILPSYILEPVLILRNKVSELFRWNLLFFLLFLGVAFYGGLKQNLHLLFGGFILLGILKSGVTFGRTGKLFKTRRDFGSVLKTSFLRYLSVLGAISIVDIFTAHIDKYIVSHYSGESSFALYEIGAMEIPIMALVLSAVTAVVMPEISKLIPRNDQDSIIRLLHRSMEKLALIIFPLFFYSLLTAGFFIPFLFGDQYAFSVIIFLIYLFLLPIRALNLHPYLISAGLQRYALYARIIDIVINLILGIILIRWIGLAGPAISTLIASYIHKGYQSIIVARHMDIPFKRLYPLLSLLKTGIRAGISGLLLMGMLAITGRNLPAVAVGSLLFGLIYLILTPGVLFSGKKFGKT